MRVSRRLAALLLFPALLIGACSSSADPTTRANDDAGADSGAIPSGDAGADTTNDAATSKDAASDAGPACLDIPRPEASIAASTGAGSMPAPLGGAIADGVYELTATTLYEGATETISTGGILKIGNRTIESSTSSDTGTWRTEKHAFSIDTVAKQIDDDDCQCATLNGASAACVFGSAVGYTSSAGELHLLYAGTSGGIERTYTRE